MCVPSTRKPPQPPLPTNQTDFPGGNTMAPPHTSWPILPDSRHGGGNFDELRNQINNEAEMTVYYEWFYKGFGRLSSWWVHAYLLHTCELFYVERELTCMWTKIGILQKKRCFGVFCRWEGRGVHFLTTTRAHTGRRCGHFIAISRGVAPT